MKSNTTIKRNHNLDYLRGVVATAIMIYHYLSWTYGRFTAENFMGKIGVYGVSVFYVLSGLTLYFVYFEKMEPTKKSILSFFKKRIFRIFPLLWLVTLISILIKKNSPDIINLLLNLSGLFGFVRWDKYFSTGVWSIGNELVFYVFFPLFVFLIKKSKQLMFLLSLLLFCIYVYFAYVKLTPDLNLGQQWKDYVNPFNQVFLFLSGFYIGYIFNNVKINNIVLVPLLIIGLVMFVFYPVSGDLINLVTGINRIVFTIICLSIFKLNYRVPNLINKPFKFLGEASYSLYLLHPIVFELTLFFKKELAISTRLILSIILTLVLSHFVYQYFEKFFMRLGRQGNERKQVIKS